MTGDMRKVIVTMVAAARMNASATVAVVTGPQAALQQGQAAATQ